MSGTGFGIAGHKNSYSTSVRCGNWVEDSIGHELAQHRAEPAMEYTTESRRNYVDPRTMQEHPAASRIKIPSLAEITIKSREGLSWNVMFAHGEEQDARDQYKTMSAAHFGAHVGEATGDNAAEEFVGRERTLKREKKLRQEQREMRLTSKQAAEKYIKKPQRREQEGGEDNEEKQVAAELQVPLPDARRSESFTQTFPRWI